MVEGEGGGGHCGGISTFENFLYIPNIANFNKIYWKTGFLKICVKGIIWCHDNHRNRYFCHILINIARDLRHNRYCTIPAFEKVGNRTKTDVVTLILLNIYTMHFSKILMT